MVNHHANFIVESVQIVDDLDSPVDRPQMSCLYLILPSVLHPEGRLRSVAAEYEARTMDGERVSQH